MTGTTLVLSVVATGAATLPRRSCHPSPRRVSSWPWRRSWPLIPLEEFAPDADALREVAAHNPFSDEPGMAREPLASRRWTRLAGWRARCAGGDVAPR